MARLRDQSTRSDEHNARGIELADRGWLDEAVSEFKKAIELDPQSAHAHDNLGTVLAEKGLLVEALREFLAAVQADPENPTVHHYLGSFLAAHGHDLAIAQYRRAVDLEFDFADAHLNLGMALAERGQLEEAVVELNTAHRQAPEDEIIEHELACCLIDLERYPDAIGHLKRIVRQHPEHVEAHVDLGVAYAAQGFYAQAEAALKKAIEVDEYDFASHYHIAALYAVWDRHDDALKHLAIAAHQDQDKAKSWARDDKLFDTLRNDERYVKIWVEGASVPAKRT